MVLEDFKSKDKDHLSVKKGEVVYLVSNKKHDKNWRYVCNFTEDKLGLVPAKILRKEANNNLEGSFPSFNANYSHFLSVAEILEWNSVSFPTRCFFFLLVSFLLGIFLTFSFRHKFLFLQLAGERFHYIWWVGVDIMHRDCRKLNSNWEIRITCDVTTCRKICFAFGFRFRNSDVSQENGRVRIFLLYRFSFPCSLLFCQFFKQWVFLLLFFLSRMSLWVLDFRYCGSCSEHFQGKRFQGMRVLRKFSIFSFCFVFNYLFFVLSALKTPLLLVLLFLLV